MEKVSVVTICLNEEKNIKQTLESVLNQTYTEIEYVIKDGGSIDNTNRIIESYIKKYGERDIKHIIKKDIGIYDAMNQAIEFCSGDWIIFINSGDSLSDSIIIEKIFKNKSYSGIDVLYADVYVYDENEYCIWKADFNKLPYKMPFSHQGCLVRSNLIKEEMFDVSYKIASDYNMLLTLFQKKCKFERLEEVVSTFSLDGISSINYVKKVVEHYRVIKAHGLLNCRIYVYYLMDLCFAHIKSRLNKIIKGKIRTQLRKLYKKKVKRYVSVDEESYALND